MIQKIFPFLGWLKSYNKEYFRADLVAGITVALVLVPQSMAYAQLAGLPIYFGLYASFLPPMIAALFGSSRQLSTGPVAVVSLMVATALAPLASPGSSDYIAYAILLAFMVGLFQFCLGLFRFGLIVNLISHPVVNGFTNAAALIIALSQLSKIFGVNVESSGHFHHVVYETIKAALHGTHLPTLFMAIAAFAIMLSLKKYKPRLPYVLVAVIITTIVSALGRFENNIRVPARNVDCPKTELLMSEFNSTLAEIRDRTEERVKLGRTLYDTLKYYDSRIEIDSYYRYRKEFARMKIEHEISLLTAEIRELEGKLSIYRGELSRIRYKSVAVDNGVKLVNMESIPPGNRGKGPEYSLKIGGGGFQDTLLTFIGGGAVVGRIPQGLPPFSVPKFDIRIMLNLLSMAAVISLLGFMEAISIAKAVAAKTGKLIDPSQELIGQGLANIAASFTQGYPVSGSFSRSAVNIQAGAVTGMSSVISSLLVMLTLILLTPLLYHLPQAVLAAIIMMAVVGLVNVTGFIHAWKTQVYDGIIGVLTFICTLAFAPHLDKGIMIGVGLSLILFLFRNMKPQIAMLSKHPDGTFRNRERFNLKQCRHIAVIRYQGSLFFANVDFLEKQVLEVVATMPELRHVLIVGNGINELDASGEETLSRIVDRLREAGHDISISGLNDSVLDAMRRTYLYYKIGEHNLFRNATLAIEALYEKTHQGSDEDPCPLRTPEFEALPVAEDVKFKPEFIKAVEAFRKKKQKNDQK